jgi:hypothetical protein
MIKQGSNNGLMSPLYGICERRASHHIHNLRICPTLQEQIHHRFMAVFYGPKQDSVE